MLYKIRCYPIHVLNDALPIPYVPVRVTCSALAAHRCTYAPPRCRTSQYRGLLFPSRCPSGTILLTPHSMVVDWRVSRAGPMLFYCPKLLYPYYSFLLFFPFSSFCVLVGIVGKLGVFGLIGCISLSLSLALPTSFNNNNNNLSTCPYE